MGPVIRHDTPSEHAVPPSSQPVDPDPLASASAYEPVAFHFLEGCFGYGLQRYTTSARSPELLPNVRNGSSGSSGSTNPRRRLSLPPEMLALIRTVLWLIPLEPWIRRRAGVTTTVSYKMQADMPLQRDIQRLTSFAELCRLASYSGCWLGFRQALLLAAERRSVGRRQVWIAEPS